MFIVIKVLQVKYSLNDAFEETCNKNVKMIHTKLLFGVYRPMFVHV